MFSSKLGVCGVERLASAQRRLFFVCSTVRAKEWDLADPVQMELYKIYRPERIPPQKRGVDLLRSPEFNKGMAFSLSERQALGIHGLLPPAFMTQDQQAYRVMSRLRQQPNDLARWVQLDSLQDRNEKLFYRVIVENIKEVMPLIYTPTVGLACQTFGVNYHHPKGLYITINDNTISKIYQILSNWPNKDVRAIVVTDGERILGLGDLGCYGIGIPGQQAETQTQTRGLLQKLLNDPFYIGLRRTRVRGEEYDHFMDTFMKACVKRFGQNTLIQYEDFANQNAYRLLKRYQGRYCMFNDDIQGTAAVVVAGLMGASRAANQKLSEMKYVFFGAGGAGIGIAEMLVKQMESEGLSYKDACNNIYIVDIDGLVTTSRKEQKQGHAQFAKDMNETKDLAQIVRQAKPHALIGTSTMGGAFTEEVVKIMAELHKQPIIFPLSNPTANAECSAADAFRWTNGSVLFASGSPFPNVEHNGRLIKPGQGNNAYIFPGVALGVILFEINHVDSHHFLLAAQVVAESVTQKDLQYGRIYPSIQQICNLSIRIAIRIAEECYKDGTATLYPEPVDKEQFIRSQIYNVGYDPLLNEPYSWPEHDMKPIRAMPPSIRNDDDD